MELLYLGVTFAVIVTLVWMKRPLFLAMAAAVAAAAALWGVPPAAWGGILARGLAGKSTVATVLAFYAITLLQRMLEARGRLVKAERAISVLTGSRSLNVMVTPFVVGLMPSVGAVLIAAPIVDRIAGDDLDAADKTFVSSYFRHIPEAFMPTYASILLALQLSGTRPPTFVLAMLPLVALLFALGYMFQARKLGKARNPSPRADGAAQARRAAWGELLRSTWTITVSVAVILALDVPVYAAVFGVVIVNMLLDRFTLGEMPLLLKRALEWKLILNTIAVMVFKEMLLHTGALSRLPSHFSALPIPPEAAFAAVMVLGTLVAGTQATVAVLIPMAFAAPGAGLPLLVLLMGMSYIASQVSPAHVCLSVAAEHFKIPLSALIRRTLPVAAAFTMAVAVYYGVLKSVGR